MAGDSTLRIRPGAPGRLWHNAIRIYHVRPAIVHPPRRPRLWTRPDPASARAGREGELLAARVRIGCAVAAALGPLWSILFQPADREPWIGLSGALLTMLLGIAVLGFARRSAPPPWLGFFTCVLQDGRICLPAGPSRILPYCGLVAWVVARSEALGLPLSSVTYGVFRW